MKTIQLFLLFLFFTASNVNAANDSLVNNRFNSELRHSIGISSNGIVRIFNNNGKDLYPYRFTYRYNLGLNTIRFGVNGNADIYRDLALDDTLSIKKKSGSYGFRVGLGYERYKTLTNRFAIYYGGEFNLYKTRSRNFNQTANSSTTIFKHQTNLGISPLFGLEIALSKHFSLSSEIMLNNGISFGKTEESITTGNETKGTTNNSLNSYANISFPRAITLRVSL